MTVQDDEGRPPLRFLKRLESMLNLIDVVGVAHTQDVPAIAKKSRGYVFCEGEASVPLDRDVVVVIDPAQVIEAEMTRKRRRFGRDPLHQAAVTANRVNAVVKDVES